MQIHDYQYKLISKTVNCIFPSDLTVAERVNVSIIFILQKLSGRVRHQHVQLFLQWLKHDAVVSAT